MGVHGLWKLIESAGKPVPIETLDNKVLAVDVSIWLHQLMKGYQTPSGSNLSNTYLLGLFTRVCKLLFTNVKPVFVFDGGVPQLKRKTIAARQQQRNKAEQISEKLREQLLKNLLKQKAVSQVLEEIRGQTSPKKKAPDMYELPPLPEAEESPSDVEELSNSSSEEDVKPFKMKYKDLHSIDVKSADFKALPADMRHDILSELKETRKQSSWGRIHEMPEESGDFSQYQMSRLLKRRSVQVSLEEAEKEMGGRTLSLGDVEALMAEGGVEINPQLTKRVASDETTRYIYVRETGEKPNESGKELHNHMNNETTSSTSEGLDPNIIIKTEIIDSDDDLELIKEVEAIEMMYKVKEERESDTDDKCEREIKIKEENLEFGTEDMFENESSSEGVIIDEMDLVKDDSGLSQNQILAIIKQQNSVNESKNILADSVPSTSKESFQEALEENKSGIGCSSDSNFKSYNNSNTKQSLETPTSSDSKILDSLYFKMTKNIDLVLSKKSKAKRLANKISEVKKSLGNTTKYNIKPIEQLKSVDLSALASNSSESENEPGNDLPCTVSDLVLPNPKIEVSILKNTCNNSTITPQYNSANDANPAAILSTSESDDEFLEVASTEDLVTCTTEQRVVESNKTGLQIEIKPMQNQIEDDIFADIFSNKDRKSESDRVLADASHTSDNNCPKNNNTESELPLLLENKSTEQTKSVEKNVYSSKKKQITKPQIKENSLITSIEDKSDSADVSESHDLVVKNVNPVTSIIVDKFEKPSTSSVNEVEITNLPNFNQIEKSGLSTFEKEDEIPSSSANLGNQDSDDSMTADDPLPKPDDTANKTSEEKPKRKLNTKQLEKLQDILETKERELVVNQSREDRVATSLTDQMYQEAQELLRLFGLPYVVAPMEAEAQCAFLDSAGLTQGTITDDSDIWLFGGNKVYKNFFDQKKFVLEFQANDIQQYFRLSRCHLILLALLVGSDYTVGLQGVGAVTALEILATFPPSQSDTRDPGELLSCLDKFKRWWQSHTQTHTYDKLAKKLKNIDLSLGFPSPAVVTAYLQPMVDDSREPFSWGSPDLPGLRDYAERKFGWSRSRTDQILQPVVNRLSQKTSQLTLHTFFGAVPNITAHREQMSRRVQSAVNRLAGGGEDFNPVQARPRQPRGRGRGRGGSVPSLPRERRGGVRGRGRPLLHDHEGCIGDGCNVSSEVIPQREKDKMEALKRKQEAIEIMKSKKGKGIKKRKNIRQIKSEANLSESSSDDN